MSKPYMSRNDWQQLLRTYFTTPVKDAPIDRIYIMLDGKIHSLAYAFGALELRHRGELVASGLDALLLYDEYYMHMHGTSTLDLDHLLL